MGGPRSAGDGGTFAAPSADARAAPAGMLLGVTLMVGARAYRSARTRVVGSQEAHSRPNADAGLSGWCAGRRGEVALEDGSLEPLMPDRSQIGSMRMCGVAGEQYPPGPIVVRHPLVDPKPGSPDHVRHPHRCTTRPPGVEQLLRIGNVGLFRRILDLGHQSERPVRERRHDQHAGSEKNSRTLSAGRPPSTRTSANAKDGSSRKHNLEDPGEKRQVSADAPEGLGEKRSESHCSL